MKIFSAGKTVKRSAAMNCLLVNQFATPGLGSIMGRRFLAGAVQLIFAVAGFVLVVAAFADWVWNTYRNMGGSETEAGPFPWFGKTGAILFIGAWLLSWITSLSLLREGRETEKRELQSNLPPKIKRD
ncbi:MAG TPA: hypothetical protein VG754_07795 [Verrucomicrobiae bacterium]|jgi:hypothetical protein|nr:hypothetical protein [Verrucomicrobiae bacterium]